MQETDPQPTGSPPEATNPTVPTSGTVSVLGLGASLVAAIASLSFLVTIVRAILTGDGGPGLLVMSPLPVGLAVVSITTGWFCVQRLRRRGNRAP